MSESYRPTPEGLRPSNHATRVETARVATGDSNPSRSVIAAAKDGKAAAFKAYQKEKGKS